MSPAKRLKRLPPWRDLPSVGSLLESAELSSYRERAPHEVLAEAARQAIAAARVSLRARGGSRKEAPSREAIVRDAARRVESELLPSPRPVINATGIVIHTNLGRSVLSEEAIAAVVETARRYTNLELDLERGARGSRMTHVEPILTGLLGAEAALVVNNNAAAMLLALNTFALGKEAVVSRGQLVEIGGSFRIPEILERAGAVLREVGTTNKTRLRDYERANRLLHSLPADRASQSRAEVVACTTEVGGGAMPLARVPSYALALRPARGKLEDLARSLRTGPDPVIGRIESGRLLLDLRTVDRDELEKLARAIVRALEEEP